MSSRAQRCKVDLILWISRTTVNVCLPDSIYWSQRAREPASAISASSLLLAGELVIRAVRWLRLPRTRGSTSTSGRLGNPYVDWVILASWLLLACLLSFTLDRERPTSFDPDNDARGFEDGSRGLADGQTKAIHAFVGDD